MIYTLQDGKPLFVQQDGGMIYPTLHLLHKCEYMLTSPAFASEC